MSVNDDDMRVCEQDGDVWCLQVLELSLFSYPIIIVIRIPYMLVRIALYLGVAAAVALPQVDVENEPRFFGLVPEVWSSTSFHITD